MVSPALLFSFLELALGFTEAAYKRAAFQEERQEERQREFASAMNRGEEESMDRLSRRIAG